MYTGLTAEGHFDVSNTSESSTQRFNKRFGVTGFVDCVDPTIASCNVTFFGNTTDYPNYRVIDTDYESYSLVYQCGGDDRASLWMITREAVPS